VRKLTRKAKELTWEVDENGCWNVTSHCQTGSGHHTFSRDGKVQRIHRYVYEQAHGKLLPDIHVRHKCDNPSCINIDHLEQGTNYDNVQDRVSRGRSAVGENNGKSKLSEEQVRFILHDVHYKDKELAKVFCMDYQAIRAIRQRKTWRHIS
jgi:hypothetical protein